MHYDFGTESLNFISSEKLALMGPSERIEMKQKDVRRLEIERHALHKALMKPCHRFSKAIETLIRYFGIGDVANVDF